MHSQIEIASRPRMPARSRPIADFKHKVGRRFFVLGAVAAIAVLDQGFKWWGWQHVPGVRINYGGDDLVPAAVGSWYARPVTGALLDLLDSGLLIVALFVFLRRRRSALVLISGTSIIGGWSSNLLDRVVMHYWTAPGSVRGVVDFIPIGKHHYNIADLFIINGTPLFILAMSAPVLRRLVMKRPGITAHVTPTTDRPRWVRRAMVALPAAVVLIAVVGVGAANFGGETAPVMSASAGYQPTLITRHGVTFEIP
jgi:lipoprotein signal peptidase